MPLFPLEPFLFCCGAGFASNQTCNVTTHGSRQPFEVAAGSVIFNRTDGSTGPNSTATAAPPASPPVFPPASPPSNNNHTKNEIIIGVGIGVPLGIALFLLLGILFRERRRKRSLQLEAKAWERKYLGLVRQKGFGGTKPTTAVAELSGWPTDELQGYPPVQDKSNRN